MNVRRQQARNIRHAAAELAYARAHPAHANNGEEFRYRDDKNAPTLIANFTKGLPHNANDGFLQNLAAYQRFVLGIQSGNPLDFQRTPLGPTNNTWQSKMAKGARGGKGAAVRGWESAGAGLTFDLQGPDAQAVTMPPAPVIDSDELIGEMAEVYLMALLRDVPFAFFREGAPNGNDEEKGYNQQVQDAVSTLNSLDWFDMTVRDRLDPPSRLRHRSKIKTQNLFRGVTSGDDRGPYLSQFLLLGNTGVNKNDKARAEKDGLITFGAIRVDQRVRYAVEEKDYMTTFEQWVDVQNAANLRGQETYHPTGPADPKPPYRFIATPRDLATYVHYDALYEAYLNACLMLIAIEAPFDPGIPFQAADNIDKQQGFAQFGPPHILSLVTEVATRALKAVRYQKFNVHRRARPEAIGGLVHLRKKQPGDTRLDPIDRLVKALDDADFGNSKLLAAVADHNRRQNTLPDRNGDASAKKDCFLLPMAFPEGSPMHPAYGAGHATVAGACVTILKAYFDHGFDMSEAFGGVWEPNTDGSSLIQINPKPKLTLEGELNKLAANIAIGRDWAGVHYFTDYIESIRLGEQVALGILEEQKLSYGENFTMTVPLFDGTVVRI